MSASKPIQILKCLADETRARLMLLITREGELCVCELVEALDEGQSKISRHLAQLRSCGLLEDRRHGQWVYYRVPTGLPAWVMTLLNQLNSAYSAWLQADSHRLAKMRNRPDGNKASVCG